MGIQLVLGAGNLGLDLSIQLKQAGHKVEVLSLSNGFDFASDDGLERLKDCLANTEVDRVWCTVGAGGVSECESNFSNALLLHVRLPHFLMVNLHADTHLVLFSTEYLCDFSMDRPLVNYTISKRMMEHLAIRIDRPKTRIVRVGSLYGLHKPEKTFPFKFLNKAGSALEVSVNECYPTPTSWLAKVLSNLDLGKFDRNRPIHAFPVGPTRSYDWAEMILENAGFKHRSIRPAVNYSHPLRLVKLTDLPSPPGWSELWLEYGPELMRLVTKQ